MTVWICWLFYDCSGVISCILVPKSGKCRDHFLPVGKGPIIFPKSKRGRFGPKVVHISGGSSI